MRGQIRKKLLMALLAAAVAAGNILPVASAAEGAICGPIMQELEESWQEDGRGAGGTEALPEEGGRTIGEAVPTGDVSGNAGDVSGNARKTRLDGEGYKELGGMETEDILQPYANLNSGTSVVGKAGWMYIPNTKKLPPTHMGFNIREGISSCVPFNNGGNVTTSELYDSYYGDAYQMHPNDNASAGKFGVTYKNAAYDGTVWYDLRCTVVDYTTSVEAMDGTVTIRPAIIFLKNQIAFLANMTNMQTVVRFDLVRSDTGEIVSKNIRFQLRDIDLQQRFGLSLGNGSISKKYYFSHESVVYVDSENAFGRSFETYIGQSPQISDPSNEKSRVCFESNGCSQFYLLFGPLDKDNNYSKAYYKALEKGGKDGVRSVTYDGEDYFVANELLEILEVDNPISPMPAPEKYISKTGSGWTKSPVALDSATSEFYYMIRQDVPWQSDSNRYSSFGVTDILPAGVDYVSFVGVTSGFKGNFTDRFQVNVENQGEGGNSEKLAITAKDASSPSFAGNTYEFVFKVRMDPAEVTPVYNGNGASYQVVNQASVTHKHGQDWTTQNTNTVTATASVSRPTPAAPVKGIGGDASKTSHTASRRTEEITYSIFQAVPAYIHAFDADAVITMTDVLEPCWTYKGAKVYLDGTQLSSGWSASANGRTITVTGANAPAYSGRTLRFDVTVSLDTGYDMSAYRSVSNGTVLDTIPNTAKVRFEYPKASARTAEKSTNTVQVLIRENAVNLVVRKSDADTGENIPDAAFTVYEWNGSGYGTSRGTMAYDAPQKTYRMDALARTPSNAGKFKVVETVTPHGYTGAWEQEFTVADADAGETKELSFRPVNPTPRAVITICKKNEIGGFLKGAEFEIRAAEDVRSPQGKVLANAGTVVDTVTTGEDGRAVSKELYLGRYTVKETKAPAGYALSEGEQEAAFVYQDQNTERLNQTLTFTNQLAQVHLRLTKEIDTADIVWAHGNPTFLFKVDGADLYGRPHTYYEAVEFTEENVGAGEKSVLTADIRVPSGHYTATEEKTMRYRLDSIRDITNGRLRGDEAVDFNLSRGVDGAAVFHNIKTTDEGLSHTMFVRNTIGAE